MIQFRLILKMVFIESIILHCIILLGTYDSLSLKNIKEFFLLKKDF